MAQTRQGGSQQSAEEKRDAKLIAAIAALLAIQASAGATATKVATLTGLPIAAVGPVVKLAMSKPWAYNVASIRPSSGPTATGQASDAEGLFRAGYVLSASRRWQEGLRAGMSRPALQRQEDRWFQQHLDAQANRRLAATQVDKSASRYGPELGWYAKIDAKTSPECRQAHGKNFNPAQRPQIGYPGSVHTHCRCKAGRPHATSKTVYNIQPERRSA